MDFYIEVVDQDKYCLFKYKRFTYLIYIILFGIIAQNIRKNNVYIPFLQSVFPGFKYCVFKCRLKYLEYLARIAIISLPALDEVGKYSIVGWYI